MPVRSLDQMATGARRTPGWPSGAMIRDDPMRTPWLDAEFQEVSTALSMLEPGEELIVWGDFVVAMLLATGQCAPPRQLSEGCFAVRADPAHKFISQTVSIK